MRSAQKKIDATALSKWGLTAAISALLIFSVTTMTRASGKHPVTVADIIGMTHLVGTPYPYYSPTRGFAVFSPNGKRFALVTSKGNVRNNLNDYSLLVFRTNHLGPGSKPKILTTFPCTSNRAGISSVTWRGNDTLLFLGSEENAPTELYSIEYSTGRLTKLTHRKQSLVSYGFSENTKTLVYAADRPQSPVINPETLRYGLDVGSEWVSDIVRGMIADREPELFVTTRRSKDMPLRTRDPFDSGIDDLFVSPNGHYVVVKTDTMHPPKIWREYNDPGIRSVFRRPLFKGQPSRILRYELIDLRTGKSSILLNSPTTYWTQDALWSPDSKSILLCGTWLPLNTKNPVEFERRRRKRFVAEMTVRDRKLTVVSSRDLVPLSWNSRTNIVRFRVRSKSQQPSVPPEILHYKKAAGSWQPVTVPESSPLELPQIYLDEDLNKPPRIMAFEPRTKRKIVVADLNPQLRNLAIATERVIRWSPVQGRSLSGGLYLPPDYRPGKKYPLVIQTHGFDPHSFWMDGPYSTAFAAQPLARHGIVVLQMNDFPSQAMETPEEPREAMEAYLSAIHYLYSRGIIDPRRVGIIGFSRTCMYVKYALTHAPGQFAAAIVADGVDAGYFQYLLSYNANPVMASDSDAVIGAPPFGKGLHVWMKRSPGFLLDKVEAPVLIEAIGPASVLDEWQWFAGLERLGKPVDMLYLPTGTHILQKPWDRLSSQETAVDWFRFWLKGKTSSKPAKHGEYRRWRKLRLEQPVFESSRLR